MGEETLKDTGYRSLFWPIILICIGVIWLLSNLGIISGANILALVRLWPLIFIVIGLDLLIGRRSPLLGALIGLAAVGVIVGGMLVGPSLGLVDNLEVNHSNYSEPRGNATEASVNLDLSVANTTIYPLTDSSNLFTVEASHVGGLNFEATGTTSRTIRLSQVDGQGVFQGLDFLGLALKPEENLYWNVGLANNISLDLNINGGVGNNDLNLSQMQLRTLNMSGGLGEVSLDLPAPGSPYAVNISGGAGAVTVNIAPNATLTLDINGGIGGVLINVPDGAAVRLDVNGGIGNVDVEQVGLQRISGDGENRVGDLGVWETSNYNGAAYPINIEFDGGVGGLTI